MKTLHRVVAVCAAVALLVCARARAQQVLDQVPSDAVGVFEVKNLQEMSTKVAKLAKNLGVDQFVPQFADPLGALMDEYGLKQGVNKNGDMAIAFFAPKQGANAGANADADNKKEGDGKDNPPAVVLIATDDYKNFLKNFNDVKDTGGGVSEVHVPKNNEKLYVMNHGNYAVAAMDKSLLSKPAGVKLQGAIDKEAKAKDALLFIDIKALRPLIQKGIKEGRQQFDKAANDPQAQKNNPFGQQMTPQMKAMIDVYINAAQQVANDAHSAAISFNITDMGIGASGLADFEPDSGTGRLVEKVQNTDKPLLAGLPQRSYFGFGGMSITPAVIQQIMSDFLDPLAKQMGPDAKEAQKGFDAMKQGIAAAKEMSMGYVYSGGAPGESLIQVVGVGHGDAKKILEAQKQALPAMNAFMGMGGKNKAEVNVSPEAKTIEGVQFTQYSIKFNFDQNDPQAMREQQAISMIYGRNGINGVMAAPDDKTFISVQGGNDKLIADLLASAKENQDTLSGLANVKMVAGQLPKQRAAEFYFALDNVVNAGLRFAKQNGIPVNVKIPPNLPPIGFSAGTEQSTARFDMVVPTQLIQSLTAAGMQAGCR